MMNETDMLVNLIFVTLLMVGYYSAYRAGRDDGRRENQDQNRTENRTDRPTYMDHTHGGDPD